MLLLTATTDKFQLVTDAAVTVDVQAASVTTSFDNAMVLVGMGNFGGTDITAASSGMTLGPGLTGCEVFYVIQGSAGESGTKTFSNSGASGDWVCFTTDLWEDTGSPAIRPYLSDNIKFQLFLRN